MYLAVAVSLAYLVTEQLLAWSVPQYFRESAYFLPQLERTLQFGDMPYRDFEFAYGPLMVYFPASLAWLLKSAGLSAEAGYYLAVDLATVAGLWMLWAVISQLELRNLWKIWIFGILWVCLLNPSLGMNYTLLRFVAALWLLMLLVRKGTLAMAAVGSVAAWSISPEAGAAFTAGAGIYLLASRTWFAVYGLAAGPAMLSIIFGRAAFDSLFKFSGGFFNFVVQPAPYILLYIGTVVWILPAGLARTRRQELPKLLAMAALAAVYVSPALGRCDIGHVLFNGITAILLALTLIRGLPRWFTPAYLAGLAILFGGGIHFNKEPGHLALLPRAMYFHERLTKTQSQLLATLSSEDQANLKPLFDALEKERPEEDYPALLGLTKIATPFPTDKSLNSYLTRTGSVLRDYYTWMIDVSGTEGAQRKIQNLQKADWVIMDPADCCGVDTPAAISGIVMFPVTYTVKYPVLVPGRDVLNAVLERFQPAGHLGRYTLYRRRSPEK